MAANTASLLLVLLRLRNSLRAKILLSWRKLKAIPCESQKKAKTFRWKVSLDKIITISKTTSI